MSSKSVTHWKVHSPGLHVSLSVPSADRVIKLECANSGSCHKKEGNVLDVLDVLLVGILSNLVFFQHERGHEHDYHGH